MEENTFLKLISRKTKDDRQKIIQEYSFLVKKVAGRIAINLPSSVEFDDLVSFGLFGLMDAVDKFNPELGVKFEYYARTRITGSIYDNLRKLDWAPRSIRSQAKDLDKVISELEQELGRSVNDIEIAEKLGISLEELEKMFSDGRKALLLSLEDFFMNDGDDMDKASFLKDNSIQSPEEKAETESVKKVLIDSINSLQYNERLVVTLYYYNEFTLKEIATTLDLTESRVCQIHSRAIQKMKARLTRLKKSIL